VVWIALLLTCKPTCEQEVAACACEDGSTATACCPSARLTCDASIGITVPLPVCSEDDPCVELLDTYCLLDDGVTRIDRASDEPSCGTTDEGLDRDRPLYADIARSWVDGDGTRRWWCEYRPPSSGPDTPLPLLLFVPGSGGTADDVYDFTSLRTKAVDRDLGGGEGFVLVSSQARYLHWPTEQAQDGTKHDSYHRDLSVPSENRDVAFFDHLIDGLVAEGVVDPTRIYLSGWSNGGRFATLYGVARHEQPTAGGNRVAGVANYSSGDPFATTQEGEDCGLDPRPSTDLPLMLLTRTCDAVTCSTEQYDHFASDGAEMTPGNDAEAWIDTLTGPMGDANVVWRRIDNRGREASACTEASRCRMFRAVLNHLRWPDGVADRGGVDHEPAMLEFLRGNPGDQGDSASR